MQSRWATGICWAAIQNAGTLPEPAATLVASRLTLFAAKV